jgi:hypothetical protein
MRALTGFEFKRHPRLAGTPASLRPLPGDSPLAAKSSLPLPEKLGEYFEALPSAATQAIAQFPEGGIALARSERGGWTSYFCATPALSPGFLAKLAELSGAWRYAPEGNIVISDGRLLGVCAPKAGSVPLYLPEGAKLKRLDGSAVQEKSPAFEFKAGETKIFLIDN